MIIYNKRKTSDEKPFFPYVNLALFLLLVGGFVGWNLFANSQTIESVDNVEFAQVESASTIDVSGEWLGTMTEDYLSINSNEEIRYDYRIVLSQNGASISGIAYQETSNLEPEIRAESTIYGNVNGDTIYFYESRVNVLENVSLDNWCRIEVTLEYQVVNGLETLVGTWDSVEDERSGCSSIDGRVVMTRQN